MIQKKLSNLSTEVASLIPYKYLKHFTISINLITIYWVINYQTKIEMFEKKDESSHIANFFWLKQNIAIFTTEANLSNKNTSLQSETMILMKC